MLTTRHIRVDVETTSTLAAGRTICDVRPTPDGIPNVDFAFDADGPRFVEMLVEILGKLDRVGDQACSTYCNGVTAKSGNLTPVRWFGQ